MAHHPERAAAAYLGGQRGRRRQAFERHLVSCDECWREVQLGRDGRRLVEEARQPAPAGLRDDLRAVVRAAAAAEQSPGRTWGRWRRPAAVTVAIALVLVAGGGILAEAPWQRPASRVVDTLVAEHRSGQLPGEALPTRTPPDLTDIQLRPIGGSEGRVGDMRVTAFAYRDDAGRDLTVYVSDSSFPQVSGARRLTGQDGPWTAELSGVTILCAREPHSLLVMGRDGDLVRAAASELGVL